MAGITRRSMLRALVIGTAIAFPASRIRIPDPVYLPVEAEAGCYTIADLIRAMKESGLVVESGQSNMASSVRQTNLMLQATRWINSDN